MDRCPHPRFPTRLVEYLDPHHLKKIIHHRLLRKRRKLKFNHRYLIEDVRRGWTELLLTLLNDLLSLWFVLPLLILSLFLATAARAHAIEVPFILQMVVIEMYAGIVLRRVPLTSVRHQVARRIVIVLIGV